MKPNSAKTTTLALVALCALAPAGAWTSDALLYSTLDASYTSALKWRSIGPASMGGRVVDIDVHPGDTATWYFGAASGGLWRTTDAGKTFEGLFQHEPVNSIGDLAISPSDPNILWLGTGEHNPRNSTIYGDGVYRSEDAGKTWSHRGLRETRHIGRVAVHPKDPDTVYVGAMGRTWGPNDERGVFKTTDGGKTWDKVLFVNDQTGVIELQMDPSDSDTLLAATWQRQRQIHDDGEPDMSHGPGSAVWKTRDGGKTWKRLGEKEGLPGDQMGRTGIDYSRSNPQIVYLVTGAARLPKDTHNGTWKSTDGGDTWKRVNEMAPRPMYYSQIRVDPTNPDLVYVLGTQLTRSKDGGATFENVQMRGVHVDHHALWFNPKDSKHILLGNDGGLYETRDAFASTEAHKKMALGQFYHVGVDTRRDYNLGGGLQDNGTWYGPSLKRGPNGPDNRDYRSINGGDGFVVRIDPSDPNLIYASSQNAGIVRRYLGPRETAPTGTFRRPAAPAGERESWAWKTDFVLAPQDPKVYYVAGQFLYRSANRGADLQRISPRLPLTARGMCTAIGLSPLDPDVIYVGSDDGALWITRDGGKNWTALHEKVGVPVKCYVSTIEVSRYAPGRTYVAFDAHRSDDEAPYLVATEDFGDSWKSINANLPEFGSSRCVREDTMNEAVLYAGTEFFSFVSIDRGESWSKLNGNKPTVAVHDFAINDAAGELVAATHGRGFWILDIAWLREMRPAMLEAEAYLFGPHPAVLWNVPESVEPPPADLYVGENPEFGATIYYSLGAHAQGVEVSVAGSDGSVIATVPATGNKGLNRVVWDLKSAGARVKPGMYTVTLKARDTTLRRTLFVEPDPAG